MPESLPAITLGQRQAWTARVELALARHDAERAMGTLDHLLKFAANLTPDVVIPRLWMLRAQTYLQMDRPAEAEKYLLAARANLAERPQDRLLWRIECIAGHVYHVQGRDTEAAQAANTAIELVNKLAATVPDTTLRANFVEHASSWINSA